MRRSRAAEGPRRAPRNVRGWLVDGGTRLEAVAFGHEHALVGGDRARSCLAPRASPPARPLVDDDPFAVAHALESWSVARVVVAYEPRRVVLESPPVALGCPSLALVSLESSVATLRGALVPTAVVLVHEDARLARWADAPTT